MRKTVALLLVAGIGLAAASVLVGYAPTGWTQLASQGKQPKGPARAPQGVPVETAPARAMRTTTDIPAVGSLRSDESVQISSEIAGRISEFRFNEGETVKAGEVLLQLDDAIARAEMSEAEARLTLAKANFDRAETLSKSRNIAERAFDEARANFESARAATELTRVRLDKHTIRAPFPGRVGLRNFSGGSFINIGAAIVNLEKIDILKLDFKVPERFYTDVRVGQKVEITVDALPNRTFTAEIYAIDPMVDVNGRALQIRARLDNPDLLLRPGLFARIVVKGEVEREVVIVPESAIMPRAGENFVYRVENGRAVEVRVELGERRAEEVEVLTGLSAGAVVVTAGQQRLRNGVNVDVVSNTAPAADRGS